jgi:transcriptional repressor NrdR
MECKNCHYPDTKVVSTRKNDDLNQTYRRRECVKCGARFTTQEHYRENYKPSHWVTASAIKIIK